jgi:hypothetical protein
MRSARRALNTTVAPCAESRRAVASPSLLLALVMTTTFPTLDSGRQDNRSEIGHSLEVFRVASSLHRDLRGGAFDLTEIVRGKFDRGCSVVLVQAPACGCPGSEQSTALEQATRRVRSEQASPSSVLRSFRADQPTPDLSSERPYRPLPPRPAEPTLALEAISPVDKRALTTIRKHDQQSRPKQSA